MDGEMREMLTKWKQDKANLLKRFDLDKNGEIDLEEWEMARTVAEKEVLKKRLQKATEEDTHMILKTDSVRQPFILSVKSQAEMSRRFRIYAFLCTALFILGGPAYLWIVAIRLGG